MIPQEELDFEAGAEDQELRAMRDEALREMDMVWAGEAAEAQKDWEEDCLATRAQVLDPHGEALQEGRERVQARMKEQAAKAEQERLNAESPF